MEIDEIPQSQTNNFPTGVSEYVYNSQNEMDAFLEGFNCAQDVDAFHGEPFQRLYGNSYKWVVRVCVGLWG